MSDKIFISEWQADEEKETVEMYLNSAVICAFRPLERLAAVFMPQLLKSYHFNQFLKERDSEQQLCCVLGALCALRLTVPTNIP